MIEGLILLVVIVLAVEIWLHDKHKIWLYDKYMYHHRQFDPEVLLPMRPGKRIGADSYATVLLKNRCQLQYSVVEAGLKQVLEVFCAIHIRQGQGDVDDFFHATLKISQIEGMHPSREYIGALWPESARSFSEGIRSAATGLEELFTINRLGATGELARCLATTNVIESPNSVVRRVSRRVTNYRDVKMAMR